MSSLTLAVATADGVNVSSHLARSTAFVLFEIDGEAVASRTVRERATDACGNHASFVEMLRGAQAVICCGIGGGAADSLAAHGIRPVVASGEFSIDDAVKRFLDGSLPTTTERVCLCH